jgi:DNA-binding MarR family transcriptional regulator
MQLLRVVSPAPPGELPVPARVAGSVANSSTANDSTATDSTANGSTANGSTATDSVPNDTVANGANSAVPNSAVPNSAVPNSAVPNNTVVNNTAANSTGTGIADEAVSPSEARALIELVSARGIAQGELAGLLGLEKSTVSRLAAGLERKGWIRRGRDGDNQRYVRLYLTPEGRAVAAQVWGAWQSRQARILAELSTEERSGLSQGLRGLVRGLAAEGLLGEAQHHDQRSHD